MNNEAMGKYCPDCGGADLYFSVSEETFLYGQGDEASQLKADVPMWSCGDCGCQFTYGEAEVIRHESVCRHLGRLSPREILLARKSIGLSRAHLGELVEVDGLTVEKWERGTVIQDDIQDGSIRDVVRSSVSARKRWDELS